MALFIHNENQKLLWEIISRTEIANSVFVQGSPQKSIWFKNIVEEFYIKNYGKNLTPVNLRELNREVIQYMMNNLTSMRQKKMQAPSVIYTEKQPVYQEPITAYSRNTPIQSPQNREDVYAQEFSQRQKEYENMFIKPTPPEIKFTEGAKDEPISNMEELIKQHTEQRDKELKSILPPPIRVISEETSIRLPVEEVLDASEINKKKVTWSDDNMTSLIEKQGKDIEELKRQFSGMQDTISELQQIILDLQKT
jgi:hypothetical protein